MTFETPAKRQFLANLKVAKNLFIHPGVKADGKTSDPTAMTERMIRSAIWITPRSVDGFNADDFPELGVEKQKQLENAVERFLDVADQVPADTPATAEQFEDAKVAFEEILSVAGLYLPTPGEARNIEKALRKVQFPPWVMNWDYELGSDHYGDESIWVRVFADEDVPRMELGRFTSRFAPIIREHLSAEGIMRWPFIRMARALEHKMAERHATS